MINWEEAPEGTTHGTESPAAVRMLGPWRKFENGNWYNFSHGKWVFRSDAKDYLIINNHIVERPVAPVEAELPNGLKWPEGATHANLEYDAFFDNINNKATVENGRKWFDIGQKSIDFWVEFKGTIARFPNTVQPPKQEPIKKRAVGWWQ